MSKPLEASTSQVVNPALIALPIEPAAASTASSTTSTPVGATGSMTLAATGGAEQTRKVTSFKSTAIASAAGVGVMAGTGAALIAVLKVAGVIASILCPPILIALGAVAIVYLTIMAVDYFMNREVTPATLKLKPEALAPATKVTTEVETLPLKPVTAPDLTSALDPADVRRQVNIMKLDKAVQAKQAPASMKDLTKKACHAVLALEAAKVKADSTPTVEAREALAGAKELVIAVNSELSLSIANEAVVNGTKSAMKKFDEALAGFKHTISYDSVESDISLRNLILKGSDGVEIVGIGKGALEGLTAKKMTNTVERFKKNMDKGNVYAALNALDVNIRNAGLDKEAVKVKLSHMFKNANLVTPSTASVYEKMEGDVMKLDELVNELAEKLVASGVLSSKNEKAFVLDVKNLVIEKNNARIAAEKAAKDAAIAAANKVTQTASEETLKGLFAQRLEIKGDITNQLRLMRDGLIAMKAAKAVEIVAVPKAYESAQKPAMASKTDLAVLGQDDYDAAQLEFKKLQGNLADVQSKINAEEAILKGINVQVPVCGLNSAFTSNMRTLTNEIAALEKAVITAKAPAKGFFSGLSLPSLPAMPSFGFGSFFKSAVKTSPEQEKLPAPVVAGVPVAEVKVPAVVVVDMAAMD